MTACARNNVHVAGTGERAMMLAHGFGCDQNMWRYVAPVFEDSFRTILFDHVGAGGSDLSAYSPSKYGNLSGYADDVVEIGRELGLHNATWLLLGFGVVIFEGGWRRSTAFGLMSGPLFPLVQGGCQHGGIRIDQPLVAAGRCQML
jgi:pimeloyl-ACP methyl ester carboxylesterase